MFTTTSSHLTRVLLAATCAIILGTISAVFAEAGPALASPRVVATTPSLALRDVDPGLAEIEVLFDSDMARGTWSWCGGGVTFPELTSKPRFASPRLAVLPVKLAPGRTYCVGINCPSNQGFRSTAGLAAVEHQLYFTTSSDATTLRAHPKNNASWEEFRNLWSTRYSYAERTGIDWEARFDDAADWVLASPSVEEWLLRVVLLLGDARDPHLYFRDEEGRRESTYRTNATYNGNMQEIERLLPNLKKHNELVWTSLEGDVAYIAVHSWSNEAQEMEVLDEVMPQLLKAKAIIVDVRGNGGGVETDARRLAGWFVAGKKVYAKQRFRDPDSEGGWTPIGTRVISGNIAGKVFMGKTIVLQGEVCLSSNEAFLLMMRCARDATFLGATSGGSSANPRLFKLPNGLTVALPSWQSMTPDGVAFEGIGLKPDIEITGDFSNSDPVLEAALELARQVP